MNEDSGSKDRPNLPASSSAAFNGKETKSNVASSHVDIFSLQAEVTPEDCLDIEYLMSLGIPKAKAIDTYLDKLRTNGSVLKGDRVTNKIYYGRDLLFLTYRHSKQSFVN